ADRRGIGILREGMELGRLSGVVVLDLIDTPMGGGEGALAGHGLTLDLAMARKRSMSAGSLSNAVTSRNARSPGRSDGQGWYCAPAPCNASCIGAGRTTKISLASTG